MHASVRNALAMRGRKAKAGGESCRTVIAPFGGLSFGFIFIMTLGTIFTTDHNKNNNNNDAIIMVSLDIFPSERKDAWLWRTKYLRRRSWRTEATR